MQKKKLLIATDAFPPRWDGIARFLLDVIPSLSGAFSVTIAAPMFKGKCPSFRNTRIVRIPTFNFQLGDFPPARMRSKKIRDLVSSADIVWVQSIGTIGALAMIHAKRQKKKLIAFTHSIEWLLVPNSLFRSRLMKRMFRMLVMAAARHLYSKCDLIIVPFRRMAGMLERAGIKSRYEVVQLGTDIARFIPPSSKSSAKRKAGISPEVTVLGFSGRIGREKDIPTLYKAFLMLKKKHRNILLLIVGGGLKEITDEISDPKVKITGSTGNMVKYLQAMDICILPSLTETTSLSTIEAMSTGLPVVVTPVGHLKDYIKEGKNGYFFDRKDHKALAVKLEKLVKSEKLRMRIGSNARKTAVRNFNWKKTEEGILKILQGL